MTSPRPVRFATSRDGTRIAWTEVGQGPTVVFAPPWPFTFHALGFWLPGLRRWHQGRWVLYERRGFGGSDRGAEHSIERYAEDLEAVLDAVKIESSTVVAIALGCMEAVTLAGRSNRIRRMVLQAPAVRERHSEEDPSHVALWSLLDQDWETFGKAYVRFTYGWHRPLPPNYDHLLAGMNAEDVRSMHNAVLRADICEAARHVKPETLVMAREQAASPPPEHARELARLIPNAALLVRPGTNFDSDDEYDEAIRAFLATTTVQKGPMPGGLPTVAEAALSTRECEVLSHVVSGASNQAIARSLGRSEKTVARHVANIYTKLGVHNRVEAANWAREHAIFALRPDSPT